MSRVLSYSEISTALDCQARWDFRYSDVLAGSSLKEKAVAPLLSGGKAWGAAVAALHVNADKLDCGLKAIEAMDESLEADADRQREFSMHEPEAHDKLREELLRLLTHYMEVSDLPLWHLMPNGEEELLVPIPSRSGTGRGSSRYKLQCFLDATSGDPDRPWLEENKLRGQLTDVSLITNSRQIRWYAWGYWIKHGVKPAGVFVNERLREVPKPPALTEKGQKLSHKKEQKCTAAAYLRACSDWDVDPVETTVDYLRARRWQQRVPVMIRDEEYEEIGKELVSAAQQIADLDSGRILPLRNVKRSNCGYCSFADICPSPDSDLVEALFERKPAKRLRGKVNEDR